jgi:2-keto-4-pentenoate hydratase
LHAAYASINLEQAYQPALVVNDTGFQYARLMTFNGLSDHQRSAQLRKNADALLAARISRCALADFPGVLPNRLSDAYQTQDRAIAMRQSPVAGWKVGFIAPERRDDSGDERVLGPIFADQLTTSAADARWRWRFIAGGFAAVEAEYVFKLGRDLGPRFTAADEAHLFAAVDAIHIGVELAGSPLREINRIGPLAVASDFGNNNGLILGPALDIAATELQQPEVWAGLHASCTINGKRVGSGGASKIPGTPWQAFVFAIRRLLQRGYQLPAGTLIATGASTGIHEVHQGDQATLRFWKDADQAAIELHCEVHYELAQPFEAVIRA